MKKFLKILLYAFLVLLLLALIIIGYFWFTNEPNWHVEKNAVKTELHPYAGFWKDEGCKDSWGWAIGPIAPEIYYISFCGPGGCFKEGTYRPNTSIVNDPKYKILDEDTIMFKSQEGWSKHVRCPGRT
jgi:hypothetical protein